MTLEIDEATIVLRKDGIVHVHFNEGITLTVELQGRMYDIYNEICDEGNRPFLFTGSHNITVTNEARQNSIIMEAMYPGIATAVVASSVAYRVIANIYVLVLKPKSPYRVFTDETEAVSWLKTFL